METKAEMYTRIKLDHQSKYDTVICPRCDYDCTGMSFCPECDNELD